METLYRFEFATAAIIVNRVGNANIRGRAMAEWEVRKDCGDHYQQYRSCHLPRKATEAEIRNTVYLLYVVEDDEAA